MSYALASIDNVYMMKYNMLCMCFYFILFWTAILWLVGWYFKRRTYCIYYLSIALYVATCLVSRLLSFVAVVLLSALPSSLLSVCSLPGNFTLHKFTDQISFTLTLALQYIPSAELEAAAAVCCQPKTLSWLKAFFYPRIL